MMVTHIRQLSGEPIFRRDNISSCVQSVLVGLCTLAMEAYAIFHNEVDGAFIVFLSSGALCAFWAAYIVIRQKRVKYDDMHIYVIPYRNGKTTIYRIENLIGFKYVLMPATYLLEIRNDETGNIDRICVDSYGLWPFPLNKPARELIACAEKAKNGKLKRGLALKLR